MKELEFNANQYVKVSLTAHGRWVLRYWDGDALGVPNVDAVGRLEMQMFEVMDIFGKRISKGCQQIFDTNMVLCLSCPEGGLRLKEVGKFNTNQYVKVKLTQHGHLVMSNFYTDIPSYMPSVDEGGYIKVQMLHLMRIFGEHMSRGAEPVFDMNMILCMEGE